MEQKYSVTGVLQCAVLLVGLVGTVQSACKQGSDWIQYQGSCYYWSSWHWEPRNWFWAELNCKRWGGSLVSIQSFSETDFLLRLTQCSSNFWIGLVNIYPQSRLYPNGYEWWDGSLLSYNNLNPTNGSYRDCVYSDSAGRWYNTYCENYHTSVCKAPAEFGTSDEQPLIEEDSKEPGDISDVLEIEAVNGTDYTTQVTPTPSPKKCLPGWRQLDNNCYWHSRNETNYFNAQMSCEALGATVTSILTRREHTLLTVALGCRLQTWIGLEKARPCFKRPGVDHCWVWMDRSPLDYFNWAPGQNLDQRNAECVILDGQWRVANCYSEYGYMCKRPAT